MGLRLFAQRTVCASIVARVAFVEGAMALNTSLEGTFVCVVCVCVRVCVYMCMCACSVCMCGVCVLCCVCV